MQFTKMHGCGNDYIYINGLNGLPEDLPGLARRLSDRHFGIGGDGVIFLCPSRIGDFRMRMFNADGSEGAMCGNGIRCLAKFAWDKKLIRSDRLSIETQAGLRRVWLQLEGERVTGARVEMGPPAVGRARTVFAAGQAVTGTPADLGNPHFVVETIGPAGSEVSVLGPALEQLPCFPGGVNVEFVRLRDHASMEMRVWERGSGETLACGTGACAAAAVFMAAGKLDRQARVYLPGGVIEVEWSLTDGQMYMTGPTTTVFDGEIAD